MIAGGSQSGGGGGGELVERIAPIREVLLPQPEAEEEVSSQR